MTKYITPPLERCPGCEYNIVHNGKEVPCFDANMRCVNCGMSSVDMDYINSYRNGLAMADAKRRGWINNVK